MVARLSDDCGETSNTHEKLTENDEGFKQSVAVKYKIISQLSSFFTLKYNTDCLFVQMAE